MSLKNSIGWCNSIDIHQIENSMEQCIECGGELIGDGYNTHQHCENALEEDYEYKEPDADITYCRFEN